MNTPDHRLALPQGTRVQDFEFHRVLGHGGFGITYLGWNIALGIDKLTEISLFWLRFVFAHKIQLVDYHGYLFFNRV